MPRRRLSLNQKLGLCDGSSGTGSAPDSCSRSGSEEDEEASCSLISKNSPPKIRFGAWKRVFRHFVRESNRRTIRINDRRTIRLQLNQSQSSLLRTLHLHFGFPKSY
ncbi:hypothetical protein DNTS_035623 [Danionella cerebrum]|uniref:Uncharacterized protein n=1 Tax=Danionella cerebrum TaxID=2873325 RepID=A0A553ML24_9TELE|nr:hypothetical protein DNTS_035623 [Danionella translucida]